VRTFRGLSSTPVSICFTSDQQGLVVCCVDGELKVWDVTSDQEGKTLGGKEQHGHNIAFSPNGLLLATNKRNRRADSYQIGVYSVQTGKELFVLAVGKAIATSVAFSPDGRLLTAISSDGMLKVWDIATQREVTNVQAHESRAYNVCFTPDRQLVSLGAVSLGPTGEKDTWGQRREGLKVEAKLRDLATGRVTLTIPVCTHAASPREGHSTLTLSPDGKRLATTAGEGIFVRNSVREMKVWDVATGRELFSRSGAYHSCAFSPDGRLIAVSGKDGVRLWDAETFTDIHFLRGAREPIAFSPDGKRLASGGVWGAVNLWDTESGHEILSLPWRWPSCLAFSPDGCCLAAGSDPYDDAPPRHFSVKIWDARPLAAGK
jgi:WD40 repeat protein